MYSNKNYQLRSDEKLKEQFFNTYKFSKHNNNQLKGAYPYEYMDGWEKSNKTTLTKKEDFYSHLNMEDS